MSCFVWLRRISFQYGKNGCLHGKDYARGEFLPGVQWSADAVVKKKKKQENPKNLIFFRFNPLRISSTKP